MQPDRPPDPARLPGAASPSISVPSTPMGGFEYKDLGMDLDVNADEFGGLLFDPAQPVGFAPAPLRPPSRPWPSFPCPFKHHILFSTITSV